MAAVGCLVTAGCATVAPTSSIGARGHDGYVQHLTLHSAALHADMKVDVYLPPGYSTHQKYPVLYLLHGKDGNQDSWLTSWYGGGIHADADATQLIEQRRITPLILVSPEIDNGYGINTSTKRYNVGGYGRGDYDTYLVHDLVKYIDAHYSTVKKASGRFIGGYSMGGFAALHIAFTHPGMYGKVGVMSAALWVGGLPQELAWIYPTERDKAERDPITFAEDHPLHMPVDILEGESDPFYHADHTLADVLRRTDAGELSYHVYPGGHDQTFWRSHAKELLLFFDAT